MSWRIVAIHAVVVASTGCGDHTCEPSYCDGNVLHYCDFEDNDSYWTSADCEERFCREGGSSGAYCRQEADPRPACEGVAELGTICDGAELIRCDSDGFASTLTTCEAADLCEPAIEGCTLHPGPDAACMERSPSPGDTPSPASYCDGSTSVTCDGVYAVEAEECGDGLCHESTESAACVISATPHPACDRPSSGWPYSVCNGTSTLNCLDSFERAFGGVDCANNSCDGAPCVCGEDADGAYCTGA